jgi:hypothetical protein
MPIRDLSISAIMIFTDKQVGLPVKTEVALIAAVISGVVRGIKCHDILT